MKEAYGNIWELSGNAGLRDSIYNGIVITTNGFVKKNGALVMGRGIALQARTYFPDIDVMFGRVVKTEGNHVHWIRYKGVIDFFTFPVKPEYGAHGEPGWRVQAEPELIERSAHEIVALVNSLPLRYNILMPRPGCGNGGLKWDLVKPIIEPILDDRFTVVTYKEE